MKDHVFGFSKFVDKDTAHFVLRNYRMSLKFSPYLRLLTAVLSIAFMSTTEAALAASVKHRASAAPEIMTTPPENVTGGCLKFHP